MPFSTVAALVAVDAGFLMIHALKDPPGRWDASLDRGNPEIYGYCKALLAASLLLIAYRASRQRPYLAVAIVLGIVTLDDAVGIHENVGRWLVESVSLQSAPFGLRPFDIGQLGVFALLGLTCVAVLWSGSRGDEMSRAFLLLFIGLCLRSPSLLLSWTWSRELSQAGPRGSSHTLKTVANWECSVRCSALR